MIYIVSGKPNRDKILHFLFCKLRGELGTDRKNAEFEALVRVCKDEDIPERIAFKEVKLSPEIDEGAKIGEAVLQALSFCDEVTVTQKAATS